MLPAANKVVEMYIVDILTDHLERNYITCFTLSNLVLDVVTLYTQSLLLYLTDSWYKLLDRGDMIGIVYLDIAKAFNTINHSLLLHELKVQFCLSDQVCQQIKCYLSNRVQAVAVNGTVSSYLPIGSGVPQNSVLGPLQFSMYIPAATNSPSWTDMFADNTTIFTSGKTADMYSISSGLKTILSSVNQWLINNGVFLN